MQYSTILMYSIKDIKFSQVLLYSNASWYNNKQYYSKILGYDTIQYNSTVTINIVQYYGTV